LRSRRKVTGMDLTISNCFLLVDDYEKALTFYRDTLGLEVKGDVGSGDKRWLTVAPKDHPEIQITLSSPFSNPAASPEDQQTMADLLAKGLMGFLIFTTDNVDKTFEEIQKAGAEVIQEPMDQFYGVRDCAFRDPAGNLIRINEPKGLRG
jgi:catechol 2,3-dioxygenase-like lactoylglutathione lyase family enzyme